ncbi:MAG: hypothetical protein WBE41_18400, partial [Terracidiphilus sp.]
VERSNFVIVDAAGAKAPIILKALLARLKPCPCYKACFECAWASFSAACKAQSFDGRFYGTTKVMPCYKALPRIHQLRIWFRNNAQHLSAV